MIAILFPRSLRLSRGTSINPNPVILSARQRLPQAISSNREYPDFPEKNTSLHLDGSSSWKVPDQASLRFTNGDSITIEAWVSLDSLREGNFTYLIGKGRHHNKAFTPDNQNWALRLKGSNGSALPTFLFRSAGKDSNFHRWTASKGFDDDGDWHHVALSYTFGKPKSIIAYIDGTKVTAGKWDIGGATTAAPISDADDIIIGTGNGGSASNSLHGAIDNLAVYREIVPDTILRNRYQHLAPPSGPLPENIPTDSVLVEICTDKIPSGKAWPKKYPSASESFTRSHFAFPDIPFQYVGTGVRGDRKTPFLLRASSRVTLPKGTHRFLLRGRNSARLIIDDQKILQTGFTPPSEGALGFTTDQDDYLDPGDPDFRFVPVGNEEALATFTSPGGKHLISMQQLIGSGGNRPEPGEFVVAISLEGTSSWQLLTPTDQLVAYTDQDFPAYLDEFNSWVERTNLDRRNVCSQKTRSLLEQATEDCPKLSLQIRRDRTSETHRGIPCEQHHRPLPQYPHSESLIPTQESQTEWDQLLPIDLPDPRTKVLFLPPR